MNTLELLNLVKEGKMSPEEAAERLRMEPFVELGFAKADTHRLIRQDAPETVYGAGKTPEQASSIVKALMGGGAQCVMVTRCSADMADRLLDDFGCFCDPISKICVVGERPEPSPNSRVCIITAGTSDIPVAEEAAVTAEVHGSRVDRVYDVGVAGLHRLLSQMDIISKARAVVVVAGMEGALPSVVGGLVNVPVIAVPTSIGYGASFRGVTALLSMMDSCASDVSVVNIDNGFGAGFIASMIDRRTAPL